MTGTLEVGALPPWMQAEVVDKTALAMTPEKEDLLASITANLRRIARAHPGTEVEVKPTAAVLHTRNAKRRGGINATESALDRGDLDVVRERLRLIERTAADNLTEARLIVAETAPAVAWSLIAFCQMHNAVMTAMTAKRWPNSPLAPLPRKANSPTSCKLVQHPVFAHTATISSSALSSLPCALSARPCFSSSLLYLGKDSSSFSWY